MYKGYVSTYIITTYNLYNSQQQHFHPLHAFSWPLHMVVLISALSLDLLPLRKMIALRFLLVASSSSPSSTRWRTLQQQHHQSGRSEMKKLRRLQQLLLHWDLCERNYSSMVSFCTQCLHAVLHVSFGVTLLWQKLEIDLPCFYQFGCPRTVGMCGHVCVCVCVPHMNISMNLTGLVAKHVNCTSIGTPSTGEKPMLLTFQHCDAP